MGIELRPDGAIPGPDAGSGTPDPSAGWMVAGGVALVWGIVGHVEYLRGGAIGGHAGTVAAAALVALWAVGRKTDVGAIAVIVVAFTVMDSVAHIGVALWLALGLALWAWAFADRLPIAGWPWIPHEKRPVVLGLVVAGSWLASGLDPVIVPIAITAAGLTISATERWPLAGGSARANVATSPREITDHRAAVAPRRLQPVLAWATVAVMSVAVQCLAMGKAPLEVLRLWPGRWDAAIYSELAQSGYDTHISSGNQFGWFPGYPMAIRFVHVIVRNWPAAPVATAAIAGLAAVVAFARWMGTQGITASASTWALAALLLYPHAIFLLGTPYSDAMFLAFMIGAFLAVERERLVLAAVLCCAASLTRIVGVVGALALTVTALERSGALVPPEDGFAARWGIPTKFVRSAVPRRIAVLPLGVAGAAAFFGYCWVKTGDVLAYVRVNDRLLGRGPLLSWRSTLKTASTTLGSMRAEVRDYGATDLPHVLGNFLNLGLTLACAATIPRVAKRFGWGYGLYVLGIVALIWTGSPFLGASARYLLAAFPVFAYFGSELERRTPVVRWLLLGSSTVALVAVSACWALGRPPGGW